MKFILKTALNGFNGIRPPAAMGGGLSSVATKVSPPRIGNGPGINMAQYNNAFSSGGLSNDAFHAKADAFRRNNPLHTVSNGQGGFRTAAGVASPAYVNNPAVVNANQIAANQAFYQKYPMQPGQSFGVPYGSPGTLPQQTVGMNGKPFQEATVSNAPVPSPNLLRPINTPIPLEAINPNTYSNLQTSTPQPLISPSSQIARMAQIHQRNSFYDPTGYPPQYGTAPIRYSNPMMPMGGFPTPYNAFSGGRMQPGYPFQTRYMPQAGFPDGDPMGPLTPQEQIISQRNADYARRLQGAMFHPYLTSYNYNGLRG